MDILKLAHRLTGAHHYISSATTGTPVEFAKKLGIAESHLYQLLDVLRRMGGPIAYSRSRKTYLYTRPVAFKLRLFMQLCLQNDNVNFADNGRERKSSELQLRGF